LASASRLIPCNGSDDRSRLPGLKDDKFLALALASDADVLVSSDEDLLVMHPWRGVPIMTPFQFL
jgi:predicted nucleic acid-binding protein